MIVWGGCLSETILTDSIFFTGQPAGHIKRFIVGKGLHDNRLRGSGVLATVGITVLANDLGCPFPVNKHRSFKTVNCVKRIIKKSLAILMADERRRFLVFMAAGAVISVTDIIFLALLIFMAGVYAKASIGFQVPAFVPSFLLDDGSVYPALAFLILFMLKNILAYSVGHMQYRFVYRVALRISGSSLEKYLGGPFEPFTETDSAIHIRKISRQPAEFSQYILTGLLQLVSESVLILLTVGAVIWYNATLFLLLLVILLPAVLALSYFSKRKLKSARTHIKTTGEQAQHYLKEALAGYVESNLYDQKAFFTGRYLRDQGRLHQYLSNLRIIQGLPSRFIEIFAVSGFFILVVIHHISGDDAAVSLVTIGAFTVAVYKIIPGIAKILNIIGQIHAYAFTTRDLPRGQYVTDIGQPAPGRGALRAISFRDVFFSYARRPAPGREAAGISFDVLPGDLVGITGASGRGKTTLINILVGFLEPGGGAIWINDAPADPPVRRAYRKNIAYCRQQPFLIHDTILTNITFDEVHYDKKRLQEAISISGLQACLDEFPRGVRHVITENGNNLSGGQRKRISLARALYKDADLIILDEPFSELEELSGRSVMLGLERLAGTGKMLVLITHDKTNLSCCNKVISLDMVLA